MNRSLIKVSVRIPLQDPPFGLYIRASSGALNVATGMNLIVFYVPKLGSIGWRGVGSRNSAVLVLCSHKPRTAMNVSKVIPFNDRVV